MKKTLFFLISALLLWFSAGAQWSTSPDENTQITFGTGEDVIPKLGTQSDGNSYVSFWSNETGNYDVRLQQLNVNGYLQWDQSGLLVSSHQSDSWLTDWDMKVDQQNHCIMALQDIRTGDNDVFVYRTNMLGEQIWGPDGIGLSNATPSFEPDPMIAIPDDGNPVFVWQSDVTTAKTGLRLQKVTTDGTKLWGPDGIVYQSSTADNYSFPKIIASDNNSVIVVFVKQGASFYDPRFMYAQKFDADGNPLWVAPVPILETGSLPVVPYIVLESDSAGGVFVAWFDDRIMNYFNCFVQHVDNLGHTAMKVDGQEVSNITGTMRLYPSITYDPQTYRLYVFWREENTDQTLWGLYGQKMSQSGDRLWTDPGKIYIPLSDIDVDWISARRADSVVMVMYDYYDLGSSMSNRILAFCVNSSGDYVWGDPPVPVSNVASSKIHREIGYTHDGQWITIWEDDRNGSTNVFGQNIKRDGTLGPVSVGISDHGIAAANGMTLSTPYPTPAKEMVSMDVSMKAEERITLDIIDQKGNIVSNITTGILPSGTHHYTWKCEGSDGNSLPSGIYCARLLSEDACLVKKIVILQ